MAERNIVDRIKQEILRRGGKAIKIHGGVYNQVGTPDLIACYRGCMAAIEVKQPGKKPTPIQQKRLAEWAHVGAFAFVAYDVEDVISMYLAPVEQITRSMDLTDMLAPVTLPLDGGASQAKTAKKYSRP